MERQDFKPELELEHAERGLLAQTCATDGYRIMHRIFRAEVDKFVIAMINADSANEKDVMAKHLLAKAAAAYYTAVTSSINAEVLKYTGAVRSNLEPVDLTEGILDIGEKASTQADLDEATFEEALIDG